jgi:hypothetical protein
MRLYMTFRQTDGPAVSAAKAAISTPTAYRFEQDHRPPSMRKQPRGRRRPDPLADFFDAEVVPMMTAAPELRAVAIFEEMKRRHPDLPDGARRTLERRIRSWRALHGAEREVIFRQTHQPGRMGGAGQGSTGTAGGMPAEGLRISPTWPNWASRSRGNGSIRVRLYDDRLEVFIGGTPLMTLVRGRAPASGKRAHVVDYRHVIHALRRKPMALLNLVYRDQLFPRDAYRLTFDQLLEQLPEKSACRLMVDLLALAHERGCEAELATLLAADLASGQLPDIAALNARFACDPEALPEVVVHLTPLIAYEALLGGELGRDSDLNMAVVA